jgi:hypothetical protein
MGKHIHTTEPSFAEEGKKRAALTLPLGIRYKCVMKKVLGIRF